MKNDQENMEMDVEIDLETIDVAGGTRAYTRCRICGRPHSVLRKYGICRICFRELAYKGKIPGIKKRDW